MKLLQGGFSVRADKGIEAASNKQGTEATNLATVAT
jgi:hypothetical protein